MTAGNPHSPFLEQAGLHPEDPVLPSMEGHIEGDPTGAPWDLAGGLQPTPFLTRVAVAASLSFSSTFIDS